MEVTLVSTLPVRDEAIKCREETKQILAGLKACTWSKDRVQGQLIHARVIETGAASDVYIASSLVNMYAKFGNMLEAQAMFDNISEPNVVTWTALVTGYVENGEAWKGLEALCMMYREGCLPNARTIVVATKACISISQNGSMDLGRAIHCEASMCGCDSDIVVSTTLVDMYSKGFRMADASRVFNTMQEHDLASWNALLFGCIENGEGKLAVSLFCRMELEGKEPDTRTFVAALKASAYLERPEERLAFIRAIHCQASLSFTNILVANTLVDMYLRSGCLENAEKVFASMPDRSVVSWNVLAFGYLENGERKVVLELFASMQLEGSVPDARTFVAALKAATFPQVRALHAVASNAMTSLDTILLTTLLDAYTKYNYMVDARRVFDSMSHANVVSWTAIILGYAEHQDGLTALELFSLMQRCGCAPNVVTLVAALKACITVMFMEKAMAIHCLASNFIYEEAHKLQVSNSLIDTYAKCGNVEVARRVFTEMTNRDTVSWNTMLFGYVDNGDPSLALDVFAAMQREGSCMPDQRTFVAAFRSCGMLASLEAGTAVHRDMAKFGVKKDDILTVSLVDMYCKCGSLANAKEAFDSLDVKEIVAWTTLMAGYSGKGDVKQVLGLFHEMVDRHGIRPDRVTFIAVLSACSHGGLLDKGKEYLESMWSKYQIRPDIEHYNCMVDMLSRADQLEAALALLRQMPFEPNAMTWRTILGGCHKWEKLVPGRLAFEFLQAVNDTEQRGPAYDLMLNIYGSRAMWEEQSSLELNP